MTSFDAFSQRTDFTLERLFKITIELIKRYIFLLHCAHACKLFLGLCDFVSINYAIKVPMYIPSSNKNLCCEREVKIRFLQKYLCQNLNQDLVINVASF